MRFKHTLLPTFALFASTQIALCDYLTISPIGGYETGIFDEGAAEIVAFDSSTSRLFVINADAATVDVLSVSGTGSLALFATIDATTYGDGATSVDVKNGVVAVSIVNDPATDPGKVVFLDSLSLALINDVTVGALPDMVTFTPDGNYVLTANEGEPNDDYDIDPEGSISVIDISGGVANASVKTAEFLAYNGQLEALQAAGIRIFGPGATVAQDLEPEYIAISADSSTAYVTLQENNALALVDIVSATVTGIVPFGYKDHSLPENAFDASNEDGAINILPWPVWGMYQPDSIAAYDVGGLTYLVTANEGDARDYDGFSEEARVKDLVLDPSVFHPLAARVLQEDEHLGRLNSTTASGLATPKGKGRGKGSGKHSEIYAYGARSFSIWDASGALVFDSGSALEDITALAMPDNFNANNDDNDSFDSRSDDKGPEPEGVAVGVIDGTPYAFIGLERAGGIVVYDISDPTAPIFQSYVNNRDFGQDAEIGGNSNALAGDLGPEGLEFIPASDSPTETPLLAVGNEVSGSTRLYEVQLIVEP